LLGSLIGLGAVTAAGLVAAVATVEPALAQPVEAGVIAQAGHALDQVEHASAFVGLEVEPGALLRVDRERPALAPAQHVHVAQLAVRRTEQDPRDLAHKAAEVLVREPARAGRTSSWGAVYNGARSPYIVRHGSVPLVPSVITLRGSPACATI